MTGLTFVQKSLMAATGAAVVSFAGGQAAQAVTFNLGGSNTSSSSISDTVDGITYSATGFGPDGDRNVVRRSNGLAVTTGGGERNQIDGRNENDNTPDFETLKFTFDQVVTLTSASFSNVQNNDGFRLLVDGIDLTSLNSGLNQNNPFDFTGFDIADRTGKMFEFTVAQPNDDYRLASLTVEPVPEPLTILGSLSALGMGAVLKKKQQNKS
ncbi:MAG: PEP-CTERM sorting domain-containing protein [Cyanobacteriota bacterium]|nr:PEP-CTERM sorting domain-containing protein [Cyanobacteriota bacterium]